MIYLDHAATTRPDERALEAMERCARLAWVNPSAAYTQAGEARRELRLARQALAELLNAVPQEIIFTSGGTEANNQALLLARGGHAVVSAIEHASVLRAATRCREVTLVPPEADGVVRPEAIARALRPDTALISLQLANNETGALQPVAEVGALARECGIPLHCDAVQAVGHVPVDFRALKVDLLTLSAHKLYGPRGVGALVAREGVEPPSLLCGGGQELGRRAGTENLPAICGLRAAAELARADLRERADRERALLAGFLADLARQIPGCRPLAEGAERLPGLVAVLMPGLTSEAAIARLDLMGIQVSGGAACAAREAAPSHVYRAMGLSEHDAARVLRVSIGRHTTAGELRAAAQAMARVYGFAG